MSTERQQQASRANGRKSHGATTPEGKLASSRNAITHGMLSSTIVLKGESTDRVLGLLAALLEEFQPQTPFEQSLIENMAVARWRQMRIWGMEKASMEYEMRRQGATSNSTELDPAEHAATRAAIAFRTLSDDSRSLELINRYESRFDRQYLRAHRRFLEVHDRRTPPTAQRPQPPDLDGTLPTGSNLPDLGSQPVEQQPAPPDTETKCVSSNNPPKLLWGRRFGAAAGLLPGVLGNPESAGERKGYFMTNSKTPAPEKMLSTNEPEK